MVEVADLALACCGCLVAVWVVVIMAAIMAIMERAKEGENE